MAANASQPRDALSALGELRRELGDFERQQAARALTTGETFSAVARSLGVSRQAAHRRFRDLAPPAPPEGRERPTPEARLVVDYARQEAAEMGAEAVRSEHLLLGILRNGDDCAAAALDRAGVTLEQARAAAAALAASGAEDRAAPARFTVNAALLEARRRGDAVLGVEHLLLGALADPNEGATTVLRILGASPEAVAAAVDRAPELGAGVDLAPPAPARLSPLVREWGSRLGWATASPSQ